MPKIKTTRISLSWAAALALLLAGGTAPAADFEGFNARVADEHVIPRYQALAEAAAGLEESLDALCEEPGETALETARAAFHQVMDRWMAVEHIRIGPMERELRRQRLYFWPDFRGRGGRQLSQLLATEDRERLAPAALAEASVAVQGLPALERLLFDTDSEAFQGDDGPSFRCRSAAAIGRNVAAVTREVHRGWTTGDPPFRAVFVTPSQVETHFLEPRQTAGELFQGFYESLKALEQLKLGKALGSTADTSRPKAFESWRSGRPGRNLRLNLEAMRTLHADHFARLPDGTAPRRDIDERIQTTFEAALLALSEVEGRMTSLATQPDGHKELLLVASYVEVLARLVGVDLAQALGFSTGFNSLDGD